MIIESQNLTKRFGHLTAVDNASLRVPEGAIFMVKGFSRPLIAVGYRPFFSLG